MKWPRFGCAAMQWLEATGHLSIFIVPALVVTGMLIGRPFLAVGFVLLVLPLIRVLFGEQHRPPPHWSEPLASALHKLPLLYALCLFGTYAWLAWYLLTTPLRTATEGFGLGLSLWTMMGLATCPAHELLHRRSVLEKRVGRWLSGAAGYPLLGFEHPLHHSKNGDHLGAEWPRVDEGAWAFTRRRAKVTWRSALITDRRTASTPGRGEANAKRAGRLWESCGGTLAMWALLTIAGGTLASLAYIGAVAGVWVSIQLLTYIQHWGLGRDNLDDAHTRPYAWEDRCRIQAWITCGLSFHQAHHEANTLPCYRIGPHADAPRLPAGYVVLLIACMVPPVWRSLMQPVLDRWSENKEDCQSPGRRTSCFG